MTIFLIILWLSVGVLGTMSAYYTDIKDWYILFKQDIREWSKNNGGSSLDVIIWLSPILVMGGLITLIMSCMTSMERNENFTFYFKVP